MTIGVELAARPDLLLFLDEPTSGLDSAGAASIIRLLRRLAQEGQAILCTIHQPSALLFEGFDNVLLLKPGGETAYFGQIGKVHGQGSEQIRHYFETNGAPPCPSEENAAEYILEVVSGGKGKNQDWAKVWRASPESKETRQEVDRLVEERKARPMSEDPRAHTEYSASAWTQLREVTKRQLNDVWRDSSFSYGVLFSNMVVGLIAGGAFAHLQTTPTAMQNRVFIVFLILLNVPAVVNSVLSKFFVLRMLYEVRESESKVYAWWALVTSFIITAAPLAIVCSIIYFLPSFYIPFYTFSSSGAGYFYLMILTMQFWMFLFAFLVSTGCERAVGQTSYSIVLQLSAACPTPVVASNLLPFVLPILAIVSGIIVPQAQMPALYKYFVYYANPIAYYVRGQVAVILHGLTVDCIDEDIYRFNPPPNQTCAQYAGQYIMEAGGQLINGDAMANCGYCQYQVSDQFAQTLGADYGFRWQNYGIFLGFTVFQLVASYFSYWYFRVKGYGLGIDKLIGFASKAFPPYGANKE